MVWLRALNINNFVSYAFFSSLSLSDVCAAAAFICWEALTSEQQSPPLLLESWSRWMRFLCAHTNLILMAEPDAERNLQNWSQFGQFDSAHFSNGFQSAPAFNENPLSTASALSRRLSKDQYVKYSRKNAKREMMDKRRRGAWNMYYFIHSMPRHSEQPYVSNVIILKEDK